MPPRRQPLPSCPAAPPAPRHRPPLPVRRCGPAGPAPGPDNFEPPVWCACSLARARTQTGCSAPPSLPPPKPLRGQNQHRWSRAHPTQAVLTARASSGAPRRAFAHSSVSAGTSPQTRQPSRPPAPHQKARPPPHPPHPTHCTSSIQTGSACIARIRATAQLARRRLPDLHFDFVQGLRHLAAAGASADGLQSSAAAAGSRAGIRNCPRLDTSRCPTRGLDHG